VAHEERRADSSLSTDEPQLITPIVAPVVVTTAAGKTREFAVQLPDARELAQAGSASVNKTPFTPPDRKRKGVAAGLVRNPELATRATPLDPMWLYAAAPGAELREKMRKFMPHRAVDFSRAVVAQPRVE
jgi:hypothetical protein